MGKTYRREKPLDDGFNVKKKFSAKPKTGGMRALNSYDESSYDDFVNTTNTHTNNIRHKGTRHGHSNTP